MAGFNPTQIQDIISQAKKQAEDLQNKMQSTVGEGSAGGGSVKGKMNGQKRLLGVTIDPEAVKSEDIEMLQDLVTAAVNDAARKIDDAMKSTVGGMLGGLGSPGLGGEREEQS